MPKRTDPKSDILIHKIQKTKDIQSFTLGFSASLAAEKINKIINKIFA